MSDNSQDYDDYIDQLEDKINDQNALIKQLSLNMQQLQIEIKIIKANQDEDSEVINNMYQDINSMSKTIMGIQQKLNILKNAATTTLRLFFGMFKRIISRATGKEESNLNLPLEMKLTSVLCTSCLESMTIRSDSKYTGTDFTCSLCRADKKPQSEQFNMKFRSAEDKRVDF